MLCHCDALAMVIAHRNSSKESKNALITACTH
jgi:hypothetical protein